MSSRQAIHLVGKAQNLFSGIILTGEATNEAGSLAALLAVISGFGLVFHRQKKREEDEQ